jgi:hypothetical protein
MKDKIGFIGSNAYMRFGDNVMGPGYLFKKRKKNMYKIENTISGVVLGVYWGNTPEEALDALAHEAGYRDYAHMCEVAPARPGEISVKEVGPF